MVKTSPVASQRKTKTGKAKDNKAQGKRSSFSLSYPSAARKSAQCVINSQTKTDTASSHVLIVKTSHGLRTSARCEGRRSIQLRFSGSNHQRAMCKCTGSSWGRRLWQHPPRGSSDLFHKLPAKPPAFPAADANLPMPSGNFRINIAEGRGQRSSMIHPSPVI